MQKDKNNHSTNVYRAGIFGTMHKNIDIFMLRNFAKYRHIAGRLRSVDQAYKKQVASQKQQFGGNPPCPLCGDIANRDIVLSTPTMCIVKNDFPYYMFDGRTVNEHLMLIPKRHIKLLDEFNTEEEAEYWDLYLKYNNIGYSSMTRPTGNDRRSIPGHVHTHLIKLNNR